MLVLRAQLQLTLVEEVGALVGVALAEQQAAGRQVLDRRLVGERPQVLQTQAIEWREATKQGQVE